MNNWNEQEQDAAYQKWSDWTLNPPRRAEYWIKYASAITFALTANMHAAGIIA